ncbi:sigma 54-interacting transcriptional regulator [Flavobacteriaceae sp. LMIT009]
MKDYNIDTIQQFLSEIEKLKEKVSAFEKSQVEVKYSNSQKHPVNFSSSWIENSPICTKIVDLDFNLQYMSAAGVNKLGIDDIKSYYGKPYPLSFYSESFKLPMSQALLKAKTTKRPITMEASILDNDGIEIWFSSTIIPVLDNKNKLDHYLITSVDLTERKKAELDLRKSREKLNEALEITNLGTFVFDDSTSFFETSVIGDKILGLSKSYKKDSKGWMNLVHPEDYTKAQQLLDDASLEYVSSEFRIIRPLDKKVIWILGHAKKEYNEKGKRIRITGTIQDITERKEAETKLNNTESRLKNTFELSPSIIVLIDVNKSQFVEANKAVTRLLGYSVEEITSKPFYEFIHPDDRNATKNIVEGRIKGDHFSILENRYRTKSGSYKWFSWEGTKPDKKGLYTAIGSDITLQKEQLLRLELINKIEKSISGKNDIYKVSWLIVDQIAKYLDTDDCIIYLLDNKTNMLEQIAAFGEKVDSKQVKNKIRIPIGMGIVGSIAKSGLGEIIIDTSKDDRYIVDDKRRLSEITVPLIFEGKVIGVIDSEHHNAGHFTVHQLKTLENISSSVSIHLQSALNYRERKIIEERNQKLLIELKENEEFLSITGEIAKIGGWELDLIDQSVKWSRETKRIHEVNQNYSPNLETALNFYHPDDRKMVKTLVEKGITKGEPWSYKARIITAKGKFKYVKAIGQPVFKEGKCVRLYGAFQDISDQHKKDEELERYRNQLENENIHLRKEMSLSFNFEDMVYSSDEMNQVLTLVEQVSSTDATVLILGETGTGKELVAKAIHNTSSRKNNPLIRVNCGAIPAELIESELFGHVKGSFTGAVNNRIGKFELADSGTLFLDEIGELPMALQPKLLRAIQEGEIEPIGSSELKKLNVRIIAATNKNLEKEIKEKRFREDLYFRLNVFPIHTPALRDRIDDIKVLTDHFVNKYCKKHAKDIKYISEGIMVKMMQYNWPGNVRELENLIERAVIISPGEVLNMEGFSNDGGENKTVLQTSKATLAQVQKDYILKTLIETNWKIDGKEGAAQLLDIKPSTLRDRMKKLGIKRP